MFVHQPAAADVNQHGARLHALQFGFANHVARLFVQRAVQGDNVGLRQGFVKRGVAFAHGGGVFVFAPNHAHAECLRHLCQAAADVAAPPDGERFAAQIADGRTVVTEHGRLLPNTGGHVAHIGGQLADEGEHEHEGVFGHAVVAVAAHVAHGDVVFCGGGHIDIVIARGGERHHFQFRCLREKGVVEQHFVGDDDVGFFGAFHRFLRVGKRVFGVLVREVESEGAARQRGAVEKDDIHDVAG